MHMRPRHLGIIKVSILLLIGLVVGFLLLPNHGDTAEAQSGSVSIQQIGPFAPLDNSNLPPALPLNSPDPQTVPILNLEKSLPEAFFQSGAKFQPDPVRQNASGIFSSPPLLINWEGIPATGVYPPDTNGQVGPNHYVQMVNHPFAGAEVRIWDKSGAQLFDFGMNSLWPTSDPCRDYGAGDPVVLYDPLADRWLLTQFDSPPAGDPFDLCLAVTRGPTPSNLPADWWVYTFQVHATKFPDYPKWGIWPDGYYASVNQFIGNTFAGVGVFAFDRAAILTGAQAVFQYVDLETSLPNLFGILPSNLSGSNPPPAGYPNYFLSVEDWSGSDDLLKVFSYHIDWSNTLNSSFSLADTMVVAPFSYQLCADNRQQCIDQPGTPVKLEALNYRLMMHAWYRNFGDHEAIVFNHTVNADGSGVAGVRWYEIRKPPANPTGWTLYQQGTYAPDNNHRWMGSLAMDGAGNIGLGYSVSSSSLSPSIRFTGRLNGDPLGQMTLGEGMIIAGTGSQTGTAGRWGDYSAMSVDPVDDCTFWYTNEYMQTTSTAGWQTRVASFRLPGCLPTGLSVQPASRSVSLLMGETVSLPITLTNTTTHTLNWVLSENNLGFIPLDTDQLIPAPLENLPQIPILPMVRRSPASVENVPLSPMLPYSFGTLPDSTELPGSAEIKGSNSPAANGEVLLTHSISDVIQAFNTAACNSSGFTGQNSYFRLFSLPEFGITHGFSVNGVDIGIESAQAGLGGSQPASIRLYTLSGPLQWSNLSLIGSRDIDVPDGSLFILHVPVTATLSAGAQLVVEFYVPDGIAATNQLYAGSNDLGQTAPTYYASSTCGVMDPVDIASIGAPQTMLVLRVHGIPAGTDLVPWLDENQLGGKLPGGVSSVVTLTLDAADNAVTLPGDYLASLNIDVYSGTLLGSEIVPVSMTVGLPPSYGKVEGTVIGTGYCGTPSNPVPSALISIETNARSVPLVADTSGYYSAYFPASENPLIITALSFGFTGGGLKAVNVLPGSPVTADFSLRSQTACIHPQSAQINVIVKRGSTKHVDLSISNLGAGSTPVTITGIAAERLNDGGFEISGNPDWEVFSTNFGTPICDVASCGLSTGTGGHNNSAHWAWFGGSLNYERGVLTQTISIPSGAARLSFWLEQSYCDSASDYLAVRIDQSEVYRINGDSLLCNRKGYRQIIFDINAYADGMPHAVVFESETFALNGLYSNFFVDDISLQAAPPLNLSWLSFQPGRINLAGDGSGQLGLNFSPTAAMQPGDVVHATLYLSSLDPQAGNIAVPVQMEVTIQRIFTPLIRH